MEKFVLKGVNGQLYVHENKVEITRKGTLGFLTNGLSGLKTLPMKNIVSIQVKYGTALTNGYIQFNIMGKSESTGGLFNAVQDENTVVFKKKQNNLARQIKDYIEQIIL